MESKDTKNEETRVVIFTMLVFLSGFVCGLLAMAIRIWIGGC